jgi:hypothetical protein
MVPLLHIAGSLPFPEQSDLSRGRCSLNPLTGGLGCDHFIPADSNETRVCACKGLTWADGDVAVLGLLLGAGAGLSSVLGLLAGAKALAESTATGGGAQAPGSPLIPSTID